jgi:hypothetical protein
MLPEHYLEEGRGKSAIARKLGISRDTVHQPIRTGDLDDRSVAIQSSEYGIGIIVLELDQCIAVLVSSLHALTRLRLDLLRLSGRRIANHDFGRRRDSHPCSSAGA